MQMPEMLARYYVEPMRNNTMLYIGHHNSRRCGELLKATWSTLSKGTQENIMKLTILLIAVGPRAMKHVGGIGYVYTNSLMVYIVPKEPNHADA